MKKIIKIPTIKRDVSASAMNILQGIYHQCLLNIDENLEIVFDFSNCTFFSNYAIVFLGGLDLLLQKQYHIQPIKYHEQSHEISKYFDAIGYFHKENGWSSLPYSDFSLEEIENKKPYRDINMLLSSDLFPFKSDNTKQIIKDTIGELFLNVLQHSCSPAGATSSAQFYPEKNIIHFSVIDFGIGIAAHIQQYYHKTYNKIITGEEALMKAFDEGFTTSEKAYGLGLKTIKEIVCINKSKMTIFCNDMFYQYDGETNYESRYPLNRLQPFKGTFVVMEFNTQKINPSYREEW